MGKSKTFLELSKSIEVLNENAQGQFINNLMNLPDEKKETVNNYFSVINAKERV